MSKNWNDLADIEQANNIESHNNLLLIDGNNVSYRWIQRKNFDAFSEDYKRTVRSLARSYEASRVIVCFDFGKSYYRLELLDDYKGTRKKPQEPEELEKMEKFFNVLNALPDELDDEVLKFRGIEADDLIAYLAINMAEEYDHTWIVSSDKDLLQLIDDNVSVFNIFSRKEVTIDTMYDDYELTPKEFMLSRIIEGDKSDNIIGIEGIGPKRAQGLVKEYRTFDKLVNALPIAGKAKYITNLNAGKEKLIRNEQLINLDGYHENAILAGKDGENVLETLEDL